MDLFAIASAFIFSGLPVQIQAITGGHIHDTHVVSCAQPGGATRQYILQRINRSVFKNPTALMENIDRVTRHLGIKIRAAGGDPAREALTIIPTMSGRPFCRDSIHRRRQDC
jgi:hypothetical protein